MKKMNGFIAAAAVALGLSAAAFAVAQTQGELSGQPNPERYDCPYHEAGMQGEGPRFGHARGMRGHHRGSDGANHGHRGMGPGMGHKTGMRGGFGSYYPHDYMVSLVTPAEIAAYRNEIRTATSVEACQKADVAHRQLVGERAAEMNVKAPEPRFDVCVELEKNGWYTR